MIGGCSRCHGTGWVWVGGTTGPYGDDPSEQVPCPVCAGREEPDSNESDALDHEGEEYSAWLQAERDNARPASTVELTGRGGIYLPVEGRAR